MRLKNINGRLVNKNVKRYLINWNKKSRSAPQLAVKQFLKPYWMHHICYEEFPVYGTLLKVDILNATKKIAVEVQGRQHSEFNAHFHGTRAGFFNSIGRDEVKYQWLVDNGFELIEVMESEVKDISLEFIEEKFGISII